MALSWHRQDIIILQQRAHRDIISLIKFIKFKHFWEVMDEALRRVWDFGWDSAGGLSKLTHLQL